MARLACGDVNMPNYDRFPINVQVPEVKLLSEPNILASHLLYHCIPVQHIGPRDDVPQDIMGRRLFLFERAEGENNVWFDLNPESQVHTYINLLLCLIQVTTCPLGLSSYSLSPYLHITV